MEFETRDIPMGETTAHVWHGGDKRALLAPTILGDDELRAVTCPVTIVHGRSDLAFPIEETTLSDGRDP